MSLQMGRPKIFITRNVFHIEFNDRTRYNIFIFIRTGSIWNHNRADRYTRNVHQFSICQTRETSFTRNSHVSKKTQRFVE